MTAKNHLDCPDNKSEWLNHAHSFTHIKYSNISRHDTTDENVGAFAELLLYFQHLETNLHMHGLICVHLSIQHCNGIDQIVMLFDLMASIFMNECWGSRIQRTMQERTEFDSQDLMKRIYLYNAAHLLQLRKQRQFNAREVDVLLSFKSPYIKHTNFVYPMQIIQIVKN